METLLNFFIPSFKLIDKKRDGSKIIKTFDQPKTPYQRLMESPHITSTKKKELSLVFRSLDPYSLQKIMKCKIKNILKLYEI